MKQSRVLNEQQVRKLLSSTKMTRHSDRNRLVLVLSYYVGMRSCEICSLKVSDVLDSDGNIKESVILKSYQTKGKKCNTVYFSELVRNEISKYLSKYKKLTDNTSRYLIESQKGGKFSSSTLQHLFKHLYELVGFDDCSSHSGRRTFITQLSERGISVRVIQELSRHENMTTTQRYIDVSVDKLKKSVETISY
jgi:integrase/recombinase XerD